MLTTIFLTLFVLALIFLILALIFKDIVLGVSCGILFIVLGGVLLTEGVDVTQTSGSNTQLSFNTEHYTQELNIDPTASAFYVIGNYNPAILLGNEYEISVHLYRETGEPINTSFTKCFLHLYDPKGKHIAIENMTADHTYDYEYDVPSALLNEIGYYDYRIHCIGTGSPTRYGFTSGVLNVVDNSTSITNGITTTNYKNSILAMMLIFFGAYIIWKGVIDANKEAEQGQELR